MTIRDTKAEAGGVTEADWAKIDELLHLSWRSLKAAGIIEFWAGSDSCLNQMIKIGS